MSIREFLSRDASIRLSEMKNVTIIVQDGIIKKKVRNFANTQASIRF